MLSSFDLDLKETKKINRFLQFLDDSDVQKVITKYVKNETSMGGRPNVNYYNFFAAILFVFAYYVSSNRTDYFDFMTLLYFWHTGLRHKI